MASACRRRPPRRRVWASRPCVTGPASSAECCRSARRKVGAPWSPVRCGGAMAVTSNDDNVAKGPARVLIVDDHPVVRDGLAAELATEPDLEVCGEAEDVAGAL